jgi:hypothetical protein
MEVLGGKRVTVKIYTAQTLLGLKRYRTRSEFDTRSVQVTFMETRITFKYPVRTAQ